MMRPFAALVKKDLRLFFTDRRAVLMSVLAPIAIASFFGFIFGSGDDRREASRVAVIVVDEDRSAISVDLSARLGADAALDVKTATLTETREAVRRAKASVAIHLPAGFGAAAAAAFFGGGGQKKAEVTLLYDPSHATEASMVQGILAGHAMESVSKEMFTGRSGREAVKESLTRVEGSTGLAPGEKTALTDLLRGVKAWNEVAQSGKPRERRGRAHCAVRREEAGGDIRPRHPLQRLRPLLRRHGRAVHPLHGDRNGRRTVAAAP
jgi:ABC-2 type transport system permease protein